MSFGSTMSFDFSDLYDIYLTYILDFGWTCSELESATKISRLSRSTHFRVFLVCYLSQGPTYLTFFMSGALRQSLAAWNGGWRGWKIWGTWIRGGGGGGGQFQDHGIMQWCITHRPLFVAFPIQWGLCGKHLHSVPTLCKVSLGLHAKSLNGDCLFLYKSCSIRGGDGDALACETLSSWCLNIFASTACA